MDDVTSGMYVHITNVCIKIYGVEVCIRLKKQHAQSA